MHDATRRPALPPPPLPAAGERWALFLDVDGTLLGFRDDPAAVTAPPPLRGLLERLQQRLDGALALVSGRSVDDLARLFGAGWTMAGLHGLERRGADGRRHDVAVEPARVEHLRREAAALAERLEAVQLEDKGIAVAFHCRRAPHRYEAMRAAAAALVARLDGYELQAGDLVAEIKPAGMDKGAAVRDLLAAPPFAGRMPVYLGDDLTDEHGFAAAREVGGLAVRVGHRTPTAATFTLPSPAAVQAWLVRVLDALRAGDPPHDPGPDRDRPPRA